MEKKELFKSFVKKHPRLIQFVKSGEMSWQKFYEIYDIYGDEESAWTDYLKTEQATKVAAAAGSGFAIGEIFSWLKTLDLDTIKNGVESVQRVVGVLQDFSTTDKSNDTKPKEEYRPRPLYKSFED